MLSGRNRALYLSFAGFALLLAVGLFVYRAPALTSTDAMPAEFSARRAHALLLGLLGNAAPHPIGSAENTRVRGAIVSALWELGYVTELETGWVCSDFGVCGAPANIVAYLKGDADGDAVLLAAHYDSVPAGAGASDDGAGVAAVLEIARVLTLAPKLRHPVVLLITDGEEAGLLGAELFVRNHPLARRIKAAVNLDARGTSGPSLMFETGSANRWAMQLYASIPRPMSNSLFYFAYQALPNNTDFSIFKRAGLQGFNFAYIGGEGNYHTPQDDAEHVSLNSLQQQGSNALAMVTALGQRPDLRPTGGEAVYFDLFTRGLVQWPASACVPAAVAALLIGVLFGAILLTRRQVGARQILWGTLFALVHLGGGAIAAALLVGALTGAGLLPSLNGSPFIAHPLPMTIACVALALAVGGGCSMATQRRAGFWGGWCGAALTMQSLALVLAVIAPGTSFIALLAAFALCAAAGPGILHIWRRRAPPAPALAWQTDLAVVVPALLTAALLLPVLLLLYTALGSPAWPIDAFAASLATLALLPALAAATRRARARIAGVAVATAVIGIVLTLLLPTYSVAWPMRLNFTYRLDVDRQRADWLAVSTANRLPHAVAAAARFEYNEHAWHAPAPYHPELAAPLLTVKENVPHADHGKRWSHYVVHLESARHAPRAFIVFPPQARVLRAVSLTTAGSQQFELRAGAQDTTRLNFSNLPKGGVEVAFDIEDAAEVRLTIADLSYGLPADGEPLRQARPPDATRSQDGDVTVVQLTVALAPARGRGNANINPP